METPLRFPELACKPPQNTAAKLSEPCAARGTPPMGRHGRQSCQASAAGSIVPLLGLAMRALLPAVSADGRSVRLFNPGCRPMLVKSQTTHAGSHNPAGPGLTSSLNSPWQYDFTRSTSCKVGRPGGRLVTHASTAGRDVAHMWRQDCQQGPPNTAAGRTARAKPPPTGLRTTPCQS